MKKGVFWRGWGEFQGFRGVQDGTREDGRKIFQAKKIKNRRDRMQDRRQRKKRLMSKHK